MRAWIALMLVGGAVLGVGGCAAWRPMEPDAAELAVRQQILENALGQIGRPYLYGGGDGNGFDCSGLVRHVFAESGFTLPRTAAEQFGSGRPVQLADALPGDLVFFRMEGGMHVGIYVGEGRVVHAPSAGKTVSVSAITSPYWQQRYAGSVRVLP